MATAPIAAMAACPQFAIALADAGHRRPAAGRRVRADPRCHRAEVEFAWARSGGGAVVRRRELPGPESLGRAVPPNHPPGSARWDHQQPKEAV